MGLQGSQPTRSQFLQRFLERGQQAQPKSNAQAAAQTAGQLAKAFALRKVLNEGDERQSNVNKTLAEALRGQTVEGPVAAGQFGPGAPVTQSPTMESIAQALAGNPDTASMGLDLKLNQLQSAEKLKQQLASEDRAFGRQQELARLRGALSGTSSGGSTGALLDRLVKEDNNINSLKEALISLKGGAGAQGRLGAEIGLGRQAEFEKQSGQLEADLALKPDVESAVTEARIQAESQAEAETGLPQIEAQADLMMKTIDKLIDDKGNLRQGASSVSGGPLGVQGRQSSVLPLSKEQRKFQPIVDQIKGQTFLEAYERLKGGGVITEIEGQKAEQALVRLNQAQDDEDFSAALKDLRDVVRSGQETAKIKAGLNTSAVTEPVQGNSPVNDDIGIKEMSDEELLRKLGIE